MYRGFVYLGISLWILLSGILCAQENTSLSIGDVIPDIEADSLEGLPVSFRPPAGKVLLIVFWDKASFQSEERIKETITIFKRFHDHGLNAVCIVAGVSENEADEIANKWQIPWLQILDNDTGNGKPSTQLGVTAFPANILIDENGKVLAINLQGEDAHNQLTDILGVSPEEVPTPKPPQEKQEPFQPMRGYDPSTSTTSASMKDTEALLGEPQERQKVEACKENLRKISHALTDYRRDHDGELPNWLSDLYPEYLQDESILLCPNDPNPHSNYKELADPKMKSSFVYQFVPAKVGAREYREWKTIQLMDYGDSVPVVRYYGFEQVLNLTYGGEIYFSGNSWANPPEAGNNLESDDAKVRKDLRALASALAKYKEEKDEIPNKLTDLIPDYIEDESLLNNPVTGEPFEYLFSTANPERRQEKFDQIEKFGNYVPLLRVKNVLKNGNVINLGYNCEMYQSGEEWEDLFRSTIDTALTEEGQKAVSATGARSFYGIGVKMRWDEANDQGFYITGFTPNSPAENAGLQVGDFIYAVSHTPFNQDGTDLENLRNALERLRSDTISHVTVTVARPKERKPFEFSFERTLISWSDDYMRGKERIYHFDQILPLRGKWDIEYGAFRQDNTDFRLAMTIFEPFVRQGEITLETKVTDGQEGVRLIFGYSSPNEYYSWNIGGWNNSRLEIQKWMGVYHDSAHILVQAVPDFTLEHNQWHEVKLVIEGQQITGFVNENEVMRYQAPDEIRGRFGLCTWKTAAEFQGIEIIGN